MSKSQLPD